MGSRCRERRGVSHGAEGGRGVAKGAWFSRGMKTVSMISLSLVHSGEAMKNHLLVLVAAIAGGVVGHFATVWVAQQGFYAMILPGALVGLAAGFFRSRSVAVAVACGLLGLSAGFLTEWRAFPFNADGTLPYFLKHIGDLRPLTLIMIAAGGVIAFWIPFSRGRERAVPRGFPTV